MSMKQQILSVLVSLLLSNVVASFEIQPKSWTFRGHPIAYEEATLHPSSTSPLTTTTEEEEDEPILLLNGFGVGSFHQHRLMNSLNLDENKNTKRRMYGIDYLGQGKSWPIDCQDGFGKNECGLIYSVDTWANQIINFIEEVILTTTTSPKKVHLVGNSVGGHLSVIIASRRPDLISTLTLLNATPVWGLNLPFWSGHLPPPRIPHTIGSYLFDRIRDENTIQQYLAAAYENKDAFDDVLVKQIRGCTESSGGGHAAFTSILWSTPASVVDEDGTLTNKPADFYTLLASVQCNVLLLFGSRDPWCTPSFAKRMYQTLASSSRRNKQQQQQQRYIELQNIGHCPNHEAPVAVSRTLHRWISSSSSSGDGTTTDVVKLVDNEEDCDVIQEVSWGGQSILKEVKEQDIGDASLLDKIMTSMVS